MLSLSFQQSKHLVERSGLGPELDRVQSLVGQSLDYSIAQILMKPTKWILSPPVLLRPLKVRDIAKASRESGNKQKFKQLFHKEKSQLVNWGMQNLLETKTPLHEHMVWFWHNHFTSSIKQVRTTDWMLRQDLSIRKHALGNFSELLKVMAFEPAMLIYLDGKSNKKGQPNENWARELLELFTLGEGNYTENGIKEAARAFTGWGLNLEEDKSVFRKKFHDYGVKTFMGQQGKFTGADILNILLDNPRTAEYICEKLWYEFVSINAPEPAVIKAWAKEFKVSGYDISNLLKIIFKSDAFWNKKYRGTLIKSPIDLVVGTLRTFDQEDDNIPLPKLAKHLTKMGQDLYVPPNVKGWVGGKNWIDDVSLPIRQRFLQRFLRGQVGIGNSKTRLKDKKNVGAMMALPKLPDLPEQQWHEWLLAVPAVTVIKAKKPDDRLKALVLDPVFQLK